jgi:hypothetical protein
MVQDPIESELRAARISASEKRALAELVCLLSDSVTHMFIIPVMLCT